jgi:DNA-binding winged helix-turn-helix (wHTH) protein
MMHKKNVFTILLLAIAILGFLSFSDSSGKNKDFSERVKVVLREVGHQLLLSNKDSVSLVLPIKEVSKVKFSLSFQEELSFKPNILVDIVKEIFEKSSLPKEYRVEVIRCLDKEVAYSYEIHELEEQTIIPCSGRFLPKNCYTIEVRFLKDNSSNSWLFYLFIPIILGIIYNRFVVKEKEINIMEENNEDHSKFGSFRFYPKENKLIQEAKEIPLSKKECELLEIFVANPNQIIKREELTKRVWEDNGVFVGRSLDTYISKLRKKLKDDASIQLINIHGVGYKLEVK